MKKTIYFLFIPLTAIMLYYVFGTNTQNHNEIIEQAREARLHFLHNSSSSPVEKNSGFVHPGFFAIDKQYVTNGRVTQNPKIQQIALEMSGGKVETYLHYGDIKFTLLGEKQSLILFQNLDNPTEYLLPFADLTNGETTYGAGRHLPVQYSGGEHIVLDFNLSESPFCSFNKAFTCPLPPKENFINLEIKAGEKIKQEN